MNGKTETIGQIFLNRIDKNSDDPALSWIKKNILYHVSKKQLYTTVEILAHGLHKLNPEKQTRVSILSNTRKEWHYFDLAALAIEKVVVPIYQTYTPEEVKYIVNHSESDVIIVENKGQFKKLLEVQQELSSLKTIISLDDIEESLTFSLSERIKYYSYQQFLQLGIKNLDENFLKEQCNSIDLQNKATIIYTSGTTGEPKGAVLTHLALVTMLNNLKMELAQFIDPSDRLLTFLPMSHVLGRCDSLIHLGLGVRNIYAESIEKVIDNLKIAKPTLMVAVPRIFEKIYSKVMMTIEKSGGLKAKTFNWAVSVSKTYFDKLDANRSPSPKDLALQKIAYELVFSKIYNQFGGHIKAFISGGAPLSSEVMNFLRYANLQILEGYGLTETFGACTINPLGRQKAGHVGIPVGDVEIKIADDGEILVKSQQLFNGYYKKPDATKECLSDGWFATGDIGEFTQDGFLKITDRKKDIIITAAGKNVAPQKIENLMKNQKFISNFAVIGDQRNFLTGIVSISLLDIQPLLTDAGLQQRNLKDLLSDNKFNELIKKDIEKANKQLARFETIKKFIIAPEEFSVENGLLTPSLKIRRKKIIELYTKEIEELYS